MRKGWEYKSFETCINKLSKPKQVKTSEYSSGTKYPIISQEDKLISGYYDDESYVFHIDSPVVIFGDHTRVLKYVDFDFVVGADGVKIISPKRELNAKFLLYYLQWYKIPNLGYSRHYKLLKEIDIPLPPLSTQIAIVSELDKINELIRLKKEQLKDFDNLAQSLFYEMFGDPVENERGWEVKKLGEVGELARGVSKHRPRNAPELLGGSMPLIQTGDVANSDFYITKYSSTYSKLGVEQSRVWEAGTLCITIAATIGKCAILGFTACFPDSVVGYKPNNEANAIYMYFIFKNMQKMLEEFAPGVAQKNINLKILSNLSIPLPPLSLQRLFAQRIEQIEREKSEVQKSIQDLETLLASRMQYWFE